MSKLAEPIRITRVTVEDENLESILDRFFSKRRSFIVHYSYDMDAYIVEPVSDNSFGVWKFTSWDNTKGIIFGHKMLRFHFGSWGIAIGWRPFT